MSLVQRVFHRRKASADRFSSKVLGAGVGILLGLALPVATSAEEARCPDGRIATRLLEKGADDSAVQELSLCEDRMDFRALLYSPEFAERFGFPKDERHLTLSLPAWVGAIQLDGYSHRGANVFELRVLVSKDTPLDLPNELWVRRSGFQTRMQLPQSAKRPVPYRMAHAFPIFLRSTNFSRAEGSLAGFLNSASLYEVDPNYFPGFTYLRILIGSKKWLERMLEPSRREKAQIILSLPARGEGIWSSPGGEHAFIIPDELWRAADRLLDVPPVAAE
jgi:hypothetical protein